MSTTVDSWALILTAINAAWCVVNLSLDARNRADRRRIEDIVEHRVRHHRANTILRRSPQNAGGGW